VHPEAGPEPAWTAFAFYTLAGPFRAEAGPSSRGVSNTTGVIMNDPTGVYMSSGVYDAGLSGLLAGILPIIVGSVRKSPALGRVGFLVCFVAGAFGGPFLAVGAAVLCAVLIVLVTQRQAAAAPAPALPEPYPGPNPVGRAAEDSPRVGDALPPKTAAPSPPLWAAEAPLRCPSCGHELTGDAGHLPPWCRRCGADLKRRRAEPPPAPAAESAPVQDVPASGA
jgi:hypothetical protein